MKLLTARSLGVTIEFASAVSARGGPANISYCKNLVQPYNEEVWLDLLTSRAFVKQITLLDR